MRLIEHFFRVVAPHDCLVCGSEGSLLCKWCTEEYLDPLPPVCYRCQALSQDSKTCKKCRRTSPLDHVWSRSEFKPAAKALIYELKFNHARAAASVIANELADTLPMFSPETIIVHVPTANIRVRQRGYDQSAIMARDLSKLLRLRHAHALRRLGKRRQVGSGREARLQQARDAYRTVASAPIKNMHVLLVDDVWTTGATLEAAAAALLAAGAAKVDAVTFAHAI